MFPDEEQKQLRSIYIRQYMSDKKHTAESKEYERHTVLTKCRNNYPDNKEMRAKCIADYFRNKFRNDGLNLDFDNLTLG